LNLNYVETLLRRIIKYWIVDLIDCGGTNPYATCGWVEEQEPDLCRTLGHERVLALCQELHRSEDLKKSEYYRAMLHEFDAEYFNGCLADYRVRVVYDIDFWISEPVAYNLASHTDLVGKQIILALTQTGSSEDMESALLHHMAHAVTETTTDDDDRWLREMQRLRYAGAPVEED
jgi:hypothetical protein